eukprot:GHVR01036105.1.p1 GENE.GHVR01036105.1~~GHVR01036105.1.p1  ORF type:complete len:329 (+),score=40.91 GHVR01036105.1:53-1039(+)
MGQEKELKETVVDEVPKETVTQDYHHLLDTRWVPRYTGKENFRQWKTKWDISAKLHLALDRFPGTGENQAGKKADVYNVALLKAAENDESFITDLLTLIESGKKCEEILREIEKLYLPYLIDQKLNVVKELKQFSRHTNESLKTMLMRFEKLLNEATRVKYEVDDESKTLALVQALTTSEKTFLFMHSTTESETYDDLHNYNKMKIVLEKLSVVESMGNSTDTKERMDTALNITDKQKKNFSSYENKDKRCPQCGHGFHLDRQRCPALNQQCRNCGKVGHFSRVCRASKQKREQANIMTSLPASHFQPSAPINNTEVGGAATDYPSSF